MVKRSLCVVVVSLMGLGHVGAHDMLWLHYRDPDGRSNRIELTLEDAVGLSIEADCRVRDGRPRLVCEEMVVLELPWWRVEWLADRLTDVWQAARWVEMGCQAAAGPFRHETSLEVGQEGDLIYLYIDPGCVEAAPPDGYACAIPVTIWMDWETAQLLATYCEIFLPRAWEAWASECADEPLPLMPAERGKP